MTPRHRLLRHGLRLALLVLATAADAATTPAPAAAAARPNFVVILAEAQGWAQTSVTMDDRVPESRSRVFRTPAVERLAREGMRFTFGYAASPRCTPSRAALFTGRSPAALHMTYVGVGRERGAAATALLPPEPILELPRETVTVAELLRSAGYATAHFGKWHVGRTSPAEHGFAESDGPTSNGGPDNVASPNPKQAFGLTARGIAFLRHAHRAGQPFYLQLSHYPNQERKEGGGGRRNADTAGAESSVIDQTVQQLLEALDAEGLAGSTYVIYTADHGGQGRNANAPLSGGKGAVTEGGLRVPFLVRGPGIAGGVCSRVPVTGCDVLPTLLDLAGLAAPPPAGVEGGSLVPVLRDPTGRGRVVRPREELVFHFPHYDLGNGGPATALLVGGEKLVRNYETGSRRLFDLETDPGETRDLAAARPERVADLSTRLDAYLREVNAQLARPNPAYDPAKAPDPDDPRSHRREGTDRRRREP